MRATLLAALFTALGALAMPSSVESAEKEFPPLPKGEPIPFNETVTVKRYNPQTKNFTTTKENVGALRFTGAKESKCFYLKGRDVGQEVKIMPGSHVIDADGNTYEVTEQPAASGDPLVRVKLIKP